MQYDPIKKTLGRFFSGPLFMRKILYFLLDLLLLRTWHVKKALRKLTRELPANASVMDAGAGFGQYTWRMSRMNPKWKIIAVDIDQEHTDGCKKFFSASGLSGRVFCERIDLTELKSISSFDLILSVDVMEHIKDDEVVFGNFHRALKPAGWLLVSTPSDLGGSGVHKATEHSFIDEHVRNGYGISEISLKLENEGFKNIRTSYTYGVPGNIAWHLSMKYPVEMLSYSKFFYLLLPFYYLIIFPVALFLNFLDVSLTHKSGTGLLVLAGK